MSTQAENISDNQHVTTSRSVDLETTNQEKVHQVEDQRSESITQRKLQTLADKSERVSQLKGLRQIANQSANAPSGQSPAVNQTGMPDQLKSGIEGLSGYSMNDVKVHYNSQEPAKFNAHAFAQGTNIHLAPGQEKHLPHEAWHVVQQKQGRVWPTTQLKGKVSINDDSALENEADRMGARALTFTGTREEELTRSATTSSTPVQLVYAGLNSTGKERVDQLADEKYNAKSLEFEMGMSPIILNDDVVKAVVDFMVGTVKQIVDAWATHTSKSKAKVYEREFGWPPGDGWYGAFTTTAENVNAVLTDASKPVRQRLKLVYNAVRNNNMAKWLKIAAMELERAANGQAARNFKIRTEAQKVENGAIVSSRHKAEVTPGFAGDSGLNRVLTGARLTEMADIANAEKNIHNPKIGWKRHDFDHSSRSKAVGWAPATSKANTERSYVGGNTGVALQDQNTLKRQDLPDIQDEEIDQMMIQQGQAPDAAGRTAFKANPASDTHWGQGADVYDLRLATESAREAQAVNARMEAGISGSTDLMIHAFQNIGMDGNVLKTLRLALAGWMMHNRDHSFYEVLKAATSYGLAFNDTKGQLYEDPINLYPMNRDHFAGILPDDAGMTDVYPSSYYSAAYKDHLAGTIANPAHDEAALTNDLHNDGISATETDVLSESETVALARLSEIVRATPINAADTASIKNRHIRTLRKSTPYLLLGNMYGEDRAFTMLNKLIRQHHAGKGVANESNRFKLAEAGIPFTILDFTPPAELAHMEALRQTVAAATINAGVLDRTQINLSAQALNLPALHKDKVVNGLIRKYHGAAVLNATGNAHASRMERMAQFEMIASMERTTGTWYSWGANTTLNGYAAAQSLRNATSNVPSAQGPGLYVATKISSSYTYGNQPNQGLLIAKLNNVPTINRQNNAQMDKLRALVAPAPVGDILETSGAYKNHIVEMLLFYGANFARLTTNRGVKLTRDIKQAPETELRAEYHKLDAGAKANFDRQATHFGVDTSGWLPAAPPPVAIPAGGGPPLPPPPPPPT